MRTFLFVACAVAFVVAEIARNTMLSARRAEYANGLKIGLGSKEELLQKFKGLNSFLVKQVYYNQNGDVEVLGKAGKHAFAIEEGVVTPKRGMSITMGKKYKMAIEEVALLDLLAKEDNPSLDIEPYSRYKRGKNIGLVHTVSGCIIFGGLAILLISMFLPSSNKYIEMVKNGTNERYPNITYGEAFEGFFANPEWNHFTSDKGEVVEFTGDFYYMDEEAEAHFQFLIDLEDSTFDLEYFAINDESQNILVTGVVLEKIFSSGDVEEESNISDTTNGNSELPPAMIYDEAPIYNIAGYYQDLEFLSSISCNMYSSPEGDVVGNVTVYLEGACIVNGNELIKIRDNVYMVSNTEEEIYITFYTYDNCINAVLYIDGNYVQEFVLQEQYIS